MRYAALWAMSEAAWPEFRPLAARRAEEDSDGEPRAMAARLWGLMDRRHGAPPTPAMTA